MDEVPIGSITNGVHTATWLAPRLDVLYRRYLGEPTGMPSWTNLPLWTDVGDHT